MYRFYFICVCSLALGLGCSGGKDGYIQYGSGESGEGNMEGGGVPDPWGYGPDGTPLWDAGPLPGSENGAETPWRTTPLVVITEILYNPITTDDQVGEWFELANTGKVTVPLNELVVITESGLGYVESEIILMPGGSAVLARSDMPSACSAAPPRVGARIRPTVFGAPAVNDSASCC